MSLLERDFYRNSIPPAAEKAIYFHCPDDETACMAFFLYFILLSCHSLSWRNNDDNSFLFLPGQMDVDVNENERMSQT
jgi:hypothetical protein